MKAKTFSDRNKIFEYTESSSKKDKLFEYNNILDINNNINNISKENKLEYNNINIKTRKKKKSVPIFNPI